MSGSIFSLPSNQSEIPALIRETGAAIKKLLPSLQELVPVLQKFSDTVDDGRVQAQALAEPVPLSKNEVSLAESLRGYNDAVLDDASFDSSLGRTAMFKNGNNPVLLNNIKEWQSTVADKEKFPREKELAFAAAMQSLEEAFRTSDQSGQQEILKLTKYIVNRSPAPRFSFKTYPGDDTNDTKLLQYAQEVRAVLSPVMSFTAPAVPPKSPNLDPVQRFVARQSTEQALKQLMSMCSASSSEKAMSRDNFGSAVEELKKTTFQDQISNYDGKLYEQKVIKHLMEWDKANQAVNSCDRQKEEPYLKLRLELLTGMVLQEILQSTDDNNMERFRDKKGLLQIIKFMMQQPVTTSEEKKRLLPMFAQPGRHSWNPLNRNLQMPDDTQPDKRLVSYFKDRGSDYNLSGEGVLVVQGWLKISQDARNEYAKKSKDFIRN